MIKIDIQTLSTVPSEHITHKHSTINPVRIKKKKTSTNIILLQWWHSLCYHHLEGWKKVVIEGTSTWFCCSTLATNSTNWVQAWFLYLVSKITPSLSSSWHSGAHLSKRQTLFCYHDKSALTVSMEPHLFQTQKGGLCLSRQSKNGLLRTKKARSTAMWLAFECTDDDRYHVAKLNGSVCTRFKSLLLLIAWQMWRHRASRTIPALRCIRKQWSYTKRVSLAITFCYPRHHELIGHFVRVQSWL